MKVKEAKRAERKNVFSLLFGTDKNIVELINYKRFDKETGCVIDKYNEYQAVLRIKTNDLRMQNSEDLKRMILQFASLNRIYLDPTKIFSMSYPSETTSQQGFWTEKIRAYKAEMFNEISNTELDKIEVRLNLAYDQLRRVKWVEEELSELSFFIVIYGATVKEIKSRIKEVSRLGGKFFNLSQVINETEIIKIFFRLHNMNSEKY